MSVEVIMPKLGLTMTEGTVDTWLKNEGDTVKKGEPISTISSEKLTYDVEAPEDGILTQIIVSAGEDVLVKAPIGIISASGETAAETEPANNTEETTSEAPVEKTESITINTTQPTEKITISATNERIFITPLARKLAKNKGIAIDQLNGTGGNGRITRYDVDRYVPAVSEKSTTESIAAAIGVGLKGMRKTIAQRMMKSLCQTAQVSIHQKADITKLIVFQRELKAKAGDAVADGQLSITTLLAKAVILALQETPKMNAWYHDGNYEEISEVHLGIAVALDEGLVVPVAKNAQTKTLTDLAATIRKNTQQARLGTLPSDLYTGSTFTISNLGKTGVEYFTPVINSPEIGILGVGSAVAELALDDEGKITQQQKLPLSLTFDHQIIDGSPAADFLAKIIHHLENPYSLVL